MLELFQLTTAPYNIYYHEHTGNSVEISTSTDLTTMLSVMLTTESVRHEMVDILEKHIGSKIEKVTILAKYSCAGIDYDASTDTIKGFILYCEDDILPKTRNIGYFLAGITNNNVNVNTIVEKLKKSYKNYTNVIKLTDSIVLLYTDKPLKNFALKNSDVWEYPSVYLVVEPSKKVSVLLDVTYHEQRFVAPPRSSFKPAFPKFADKLGVFANEIMAKINK